MNLSKIPSKPNSKAGSKGLLTLSALSLLSVLLSSPAQAINKCQDAQGKWHYGDSVQHKCENAKVTTLNNRGVVKGEVAAPKTEAEKAAAQAKSEQLAKERAKQKVIDEERNRILGAYEKEDDIERARENNLRSIRQQMVLRDAYINSITEQRKLKLKKIDTVSSTAIKSSLRSEVDNIDQELIESQKAKKDLDKKMEQVNKHYDSEVASFKKYQKEQKTRNVAH